MLHDTVRPGMGDFAGSTLRLSSFGGAFVVMFASLVVPFEADAQTDVSAPGQAQAIKPVERGFFANLELGPSFLVAPDAAVDYGLSTSVSVHFGIDILPILNIALGVGVLAAESSLDSEGALRDRFYISPTARAQLAILTTERHFLWLRGEGGISFLEADASQTEGASELGPTFGGGIGYEYFTTLRHFSIGAQAGVQVLLEPDTAFRIFLMPSLKYTF